MKRFLPALFLMIAPAAFAGNGFPGSNDNQKTTDSVECREVLVVVYNVTGEENYSKVRLVNVEEKQITAVDPYERLSDGVYMVVASSDQGFYRQTLIINNSNQAACKEGQ